MIFGPTVVENLGTLLDRWGDTYLKEGRRLLPLTKVTNQRLIIRFLHDWLREMDESYKILETL